MHSRLSGRPRSASRLGNMITLSSHLILYERRVPNNTTLTRWRRKLGQLEISRSGLEAALEVIEANRGQKLERGGRIVVYVAWDPISSKGKQRMIVGRGCMQHWSVVDSMCRRLMTGAYVLLATDQPRSGQQSIAGRASSWRRRNSTKAGSGH